MLMNWAVRQFRGVSWAFLSQSKTATMRSMNTKRLNLTDTVPLTQTEDGIVRVIGSRVTLDTLVARFEQGNTFADIHEGFPTLSLAQIKAVIAWYLDNRADVQEYIDERYAEAERMWKEIQSQPGYVPISEIIRRHREQLNKT